MHQHLPLSRNNFSQRIFTKILFYQICSIWLHILPFILSFIVYIPLGTIGYESTKVLFFQISIIAVTACIGIPLLFQKKHISRIEIVFILLLVIFILVQLLSSGINHSLNTSLIGNQWYVFGIITLTFLSVYSLLVGYLHDQKHMYIMTFSAVATGIIHSGIVLFIFIQNGVSRPISLMGEPNWLGLLLCVCLLFCIFAYTEKKLKKWRLYTSISTIVIASILLCTYSRSSLVAAVCALAVFVVLIRIKIRPQMQIITIIGLNFVLFAGVLFSGLYTHSFTSRIYSLPLRGFSGTDSRLWIYEKGIKLWMEKPLLGWGWETLPQIFQLDIPDTRRGMEHMIIPRSHNMFLDLLLSGGIAGFSLFFAIIALSLAQLSRHYYQTNNKEYLLYIALWTALLVYGQFNPFSIVHWVCMFFLIGKSMKNHSII